MKKISTLVAFIATVAVTAQNLQMHYDFEREQITTTLEFFKMDSYGNTYTFIDLDYNAKAGISGAYFEIARVLKTKKMPVGLHIEYNGGLGTFGNAPNQGGYTINEAWILGANYSKGNATWGFSTYAGYKAFTGIGGEGNYQVTGTWYYNFAKNFSFSGFADVWSENGLTDKTVFLSEPQLWYHLNKTFSIGGEVEFSNNFAHVFEFKVRPTVAIKWNL